MQNSSYIPPVGNKIEFLIVSWHDSRKHASYLFVSGSGRLLCVAPQRPPPVGLTPLSSKKGPYGSYLKI
jgi:hypothetical protein